MSIQHDKPKGFFYVLRHCLSSALFGLRDGWSTTWTEHKTHREQQAKQAECVKGGGHWLTLDTDVLPAFTLGEFRVVYECQRCGYFDWLERKTPEYTMPKGLLKL